MHDCGKLHFESNHSRVLITRWIEQSQTQFEWPQHSQMKVVGFKDVTKYINASFLNYGIPVKKGKLEHFGMS